MVKLLTSFDSAFCQNFIVVPLLVTPNTTHLASYLTTLYHYKHVILITVCAKVGRVKF